eukprot:COSAG03_NODE_9328_length_729_cov_1.030159_1_plen_88_part_00
MVVAMAEEAAVAVPGPVDWEARCGFPVASSPSVSAGHQILCLQTEPAQTRTRHSGRLSGAVCHLVDQVGLSQEKVWGLAQAWDQDQG